MFKEFNPFLKCNYDQYRIIKYVRNHTQRYSDKDERLPVTMSLTEIAKKFGYTNPDNIKDYLQEEINKGYISIINNELFPNPDTCDDYIRNYRAENIKNILVRSVYIPIITSFITTILISILSWLLG